MSYFRDEQSRGWGPLRPGLMAVLSRMLGPRKIPLCTMSHLRGRSYWQLVIKGLRTKCFPGRAFPKSYLFLSLIPHAGHSVRSTVDCTEAHEVMGSLPRVPEQSP